MALGLTHLLDTDICVEIIRARSLPLIKKMRQTAPQAVALSTITLAELRFGAYRSSDPARNLRALQSFIAPLSILDFDVDAAEAYGQVRSALEGAGTPIGPLDTLIAAHALSLGLTLVTNNEREFRRVPGLAVENWLA